MLALTEKLEEYQIPEGRELRTSLQIAEERAGIAQRRGFRVLVGDQQLMIDGSQESELPSNRDMLIYLRSRGFSFAELREVLQYQPLRKAYAVASDSGDAFDPQTYLESVRPRAMVGHDGSFLIYTRSPNSVDDITQEQVVSRRKVIPFRGHVLRPLATAASLALVALPVLAGGTSLNLQQDVNYAAGSSDQVDSITRLGLDASNVDVALRYGSLGCETIFGVRPYFQFGDSLSLIPTLSVLHGMDDSDGATDRHFTDEKFQLETRLNTELALIAAGIVYGRDEKSILRDAYTIVESSIGSFGLSLSDYNGESGLNYYAVFDCASITDHPHFSDLALGFGTRGIRTEDTDLHWAGFRNADKVVGYRVVAVSDLANGNALDFDEGLKVVDAILTINNRKLSKPGFMGYKSSDLDFGLGGEIYGATAPWLSSIQGQNLIVPYYREFPRSEFIPTFPDRGEFSAHAHLTSADKKVGVALNSGARGTYLGSYYGLDTGDISPVFGVQTGGFSLFGVDVSGLQLVGQYNFVGDKFTGDGTKRRDSAYVIAFMSIPLGKAK